MITKVDSNNAAAYKKLFLKANDPLNFTEDDGISSLDEYFQWIEELANEDLKYVVLPLDEPAFEINANSRAITVPDEFVQNGISVQGDEGAEIVFFKIDRYFDATDLGASDTKIIIQWEGAAPGNNVAATCGTSNALIRDIESEPGKLIFGWYLDDTITEYPGNIKFAVRIYKTNSQQECTYNFSTLTATATINPSLDLDLSEYQFLDTPELWIRNRLKNSPSQESTTPANKPVYRINLLQYSDTDLVELDASTGVTTLVVETTTGDAGVVGYTWYRWDVTDKNKVYTPDKPASTKVYKVTTKSTFGPENYYRKKVVDGVTNYEIISDYKVNGVEYLDIAEWCEQKTLNSDVVTPSQIYELFNECVVSQTGYYQVVAQNRVGKSRESQESNTCLVPGPTTIKAFSISPDIAEDDENAEKISDVLGHVFLEGEADVAGEANVKVAVNHDENNTTTYSWALEDAAIADSNQDNWDIEVEAANRALYDKTYTVSVYDTRNKDVTETKSVDFRVTDKAHEIPRSVPTVKIAGEDSGDMFKDAIKTGTEIDLEDYFNYSAVLHDAVQYQWYGLKGTAIGDNDDELSGATSRNYTPSTAVDIFCKVTNQIKDGDTVVSEKSFFTPVFHIVASD